MSLQIAISSCAFPSKNASEVDAIGVENNFIVEFSSGFPYEPDLDKKFLSARCRKWIHNYFPIPEKAFVLNLASADPDIQRKSIEHGQLALSLASRAGLPFYSIHAGFGVDPKVDQLGQPFESIDGNRALRDQIWARFIEAIHKLLTTADSCGVDLYVENNVVILPNKSIPLLCAEPAEIRQLFEEIRSPRLGLLLDTGHAKVSAQTFGFTTDTFVRAVKPHVRAVHHSENEGRRDSNQPLGTDYWFLKYMPEFKNAYHVIEVNDLSAAEARQQLHLLESAALGSALPC